MKMSLVALFITISIFGSTQGYTLYGLTKSGGLHNEGTIFSYNPDTHDYRVLYSFGTNSFDTDSADGASPQGALIQASNGLLYGVTQTGGISNNGSIFSYDIATESYSNLYNLGFSDDCANPSGALFEGSPGVLFGLTSGGGAAEVGTIFSYDITTRVFTKLYDFDYFADGFQQPYCNFVVNSEGMLYATTVSHANNSGTIFSYNLANHLLTVLLSLDTSEVRGEPSVPSLVLVNDSMLYGTTSSSDSGSIFIYNIRTGAYAEVHEFDNQLNGTSFWGTLIKANNGLFYGTAADGGALQGGVLYSFNPVDDTEILLHNFGHAGDGSTPESSLIQATDGLLYGMTVNGGVAGDGLMYSYNTANNEYIALHQFTGDSDGMFPSFALLQVGFPLSVPQIASTPKLEISPNPSTGQFTIQLPSNESNYQAQIYNTLGQKIEELTLTNNQNTLNLSNQATGMYFITLQTSNGPVTGKVMVER